MGWICPKCGKEYPWCVATCCEVEDEQQEEEWVDWYDSHIDTNIRSLIRLLRNNGWNTVSSCGHEYDGLIEIQCYDEQGGEMLGEGKDLLTSLQWLLWDNGYQDFTMEHRKASEGGRITQEFIILKMGKRAVENINGPTS